MRADRDTYFTAFHTVAGDISPACARRISHQFLFSPDRFQFAEITSSQDGLAHELLHLHTCIVLSETRR